MSPRYSNVTTSIRGYNYTICITQSQIHLFNQHKGPHRVPQSSTGESRRKCVPTPMHRFMGGTHKLITKTYIKWITWYPIVTQISMARHTSSVLKSLKTQSDKITSKGKLNPLHEGRGGETSYDPTILAKLVVHQDRAKSRTWERDQTHSY